MRTLRMAMLLLSISALAVEAMQPPVWLRAFDRVWLTVKEKHWDRTKTGTPWEEARAKLRPKVEQATTEREARAVMQELLASLGQSHFGIIPREAYSAWDEGSGGNEADAGLDLRIVENKPLVSRVAAGSVAEEAGVRPGWVLIRSAGRGLAERLEKQAPLAQWMIAMRALQGREGEEREAVFETGDGTLRTMKLVLRQRPGRIVKFGNLPALSMELERRALTDGTQYLRWNAFFEPDWLNTEVKAAIEGCRECPGLVLDLRGNLGGIAMLAATVTGWLVDRQESIGSVISVAGTLKLVAFPRPQPFRGKVAVLTDELSISTAEFLAAGLKDLGRARLFGRTTQGAALPSVVEKLETGDGFQYATADYVSRSGARVEGVGVKPDVEIPLKRSDLVMGRDAVLDSALQWLNESPRKGKEAGE